MICPDLVLQSPGLEASAYRPGPLSLFVSLFYQFHFSVSSSEWDISEDSGGNSSNTYFGKVLLSTRCCDCSSNLIFSSIPIDNKS